MLRVAHSTPDADSLGELLAPYLDVSRVRYFCRGLTDVFTVDDAYFARVYPSGCAPRPISDGRWSCCGIWTVMVPR